MDAVVEARVDVGERVHRHASEERADVAERSRERFERAPDDLRQTDGRVTGLRVGVVQVDGARVTTGLTRDDPLEQRRQADGWCSKVRACAITRAPVAAATAAHAAQRRQRLLKVLLLILTDVRRSSARKPLMFFGIPATPGSEVLMTRPPSANFGTMVARPFRRPPCLSTPSDCTTWAGCTNSLFDSRARIRSSRGPPGPWTCPPVANEK